MFFAADSETARVFGQQGQLYASVETFSERVRALGLRVIRTEEAVTRTGKICVGDGWPLKETDRWSQLAVYMQRG